jgi:type I restriction-modification system DNA methylase subunit
MSGVDRDQIRIKATGEVFTPTPLVTEMLDQIDPAAYMNQNNTFIDSSCGDGQFLSEVLIRKLENGHDFETALSTIYGVDIMLDNVELCRERLLCGHEELRHVVEANILVGNTLDPLASVPFQTKQDRARMKELFHKSQSDHAVDSLVSTGLFELA